MVREMSRVVAARGPSHFSGRMLAHFRKQQRRLRAAPELSMPAGCVCYVAVSSE